MKSSDLRTETRITERLFPARKDYWCVGIDSGYSAVKLIAPNKYARIPFLGCRIPKDRISLKEPDETDIRYRDPSDPAGIWIVGDLAYSESRMAGLIESEAELYGRNRYYSEMFLVLFRTSLGISLMENGCGAPKDMPVKIMLGLPPKYMDDASVLKDVLSGSHRFELKMGPGPWVGFDICLATSDILVMPQPLGALTSVSVDKNGRPLPDAGKYFHNCKTLVIDPGFGTLDVFVVSNGDVSRIESGTYPDLAMREVFERTRREIRDICGEDISVPVLVSHLEDGTIRVMKDRRSMKRIRFDFSEILERNVREVCHDALEKLKSVHNYFQDIDYIITSGGTYAAWEKDFSAEFSDMDGLVIVPGNINDPALPHIFDNVRGYYFYLNGMRLS